MASREFVELKLGKTVLRATHAYFLKIKLVKSSCQTTWRASFSA
jgi:hypothetical protein